MKDTSFHPLDKLPDCGSAKLFVSFDEFLFPNPDFLAAWIYLLSFGALHLDSTLLVQSHQVRIEPALPGP